MKSLLLVFLGGGIGSALRFYISKLTCLYSGTMPWGTFSVNIIGSFIIGILMGLVLKNTFTSETTTLLLVAGFCGGFTTFSAFAFENFQFLKNGDISNFLLYTVGSLVVGLFAVLMGIWISRLI